MSEEMPGDARVIALDANVPLGYRDAAEPPQKPSLLSVVPQFLRQAWHERRIRYFRHIVFRSSENEAARRAYAAMEPWEFEGINARQAWANWRTIPSNLKGRVPPYPIRALDLCCGTGQSTAVLAFHLAPGSEILGLEWSPQFVSLARSRSYLTAKASDARVWFRAQSVLDAFRDSEGTPLADSSIDLVNSSGAVGCHFDARATSVLADEVARVLRRGGLALIDSGPFGTTPEEVRRIFGERGFEERHSARSCFLDPYLQICFRMRRRESH